MSTDREFTEFLQSLPREKSQAQVDQTERQHDVERGPYIPHQGGWHTFEEARH